jgi:hypothetical protein
VPQVASAPIGSEVSCRRQSMRPLSVMSREGRRHMATKDKGGSKSRKKAPARTLKTEAPDQEGEASGRTAK